MPKYLQQPQTTKSLNNPRKVNYFGDRELSQDYYVSENKLYKKMKSGEFREILPQKNGNYTFFFLKNKGEGKSRINTKYLDRMIYKNNDGEMVEDNIIENENNDVIVNEIPENEIIYEIRLIDGDTGDEIFYKRGDRFYEMINGILEDESYDGIYHDENEPNKIVIVVYDLDEY
jgi:hypothetical protein